MSAASAKPAPSLKDALELLADAIDEIIGLESLRAPQEASYRPISNARAYVAQAAAILEAQPAAERTAVQSLKDLYNFIQDKRNRAHKYLKTHPEDLRVRGQRQGYEVIRVRLKQALDRFDAQERAGAQA